jgi:hypothetical protein
MAITGVGGAPAVAPQTAVQPAAAGTAGDANAAGGAIDANMAESKAITQGLAAMGEQITGQMQQTSEEAGKRGQKIVDEMIQEMKK